MLKRFFTLFLAAFAFIVLFSHHAFSASYDTYSIRTKHDRYSIKKNIDGFYYIGSEKVTLEPLSDFLPLLNGAVEGVCPTLGKTADAKIVAINEDKSGLGKRTVRTLEIYVKEKIIKRKNECSPIQGDGVYYFPLHRVWFTGKDVLSISVEKSMKASKDGQTLVDVEKSSGSWKNASGGLGTNWDFFRRFVSSFEDFPVTARLHEAIGSQKPSVDITIDNRPYKAYLVGKNLWAMKFPGVDWLVASSNWSVWEDMSQASWSDRFSPTLKKIIDKSASIDERKSAINSLGVKWSPSIKKTLQTLVEDKSDDADLRVLAIKMLRRKPSDDNFGVFIRALDPDASDEILHQLTRALRVKNPRGPKIKQGMDRNSVENAILEWQTWWDKVGN